MTTVLDKPLKRQVTVDGLDYTIVVDPDGVRVTGKGKRRAEVELRWRDLLSGEAALSVALNASLLQRKTTTDPDIDPPIDPAHKRSSKKKAR